MRKSKEYIISYVLFCVSIVLSCTAMIVGLVRIDSSIERICYFLGVAFLGFGFVLWQKAKENSDNKGQ